MSEEKILTAPSKAQKGLEDYVKTMNQLTNLKDILADMINEHQPILSRIQVEALKKISKQFKDLRDFIEEQYHCYVICNEENIFGIKKTYEFHKDKIVLKIEEVKL